MSGEDARPMPEHNSYSPAATPHPPTPSPPPGVSLGQELEGFREFTSGLPPDMRGLAISNSDLIREVHNSFARPEPLVPDEDDKANKVGGLRAGPAHASCCRIPVSTQLTLDLLGSKHTDVLGWTLLILLLSWLADWVCGRVGAG
jgi:hypothetical protein